LTPRSMTLDDLELLQGRILSEFRVFGRLQHGTLSFTRWHYQHFSETVLHNAVARLLSVSYGLSCLQTDALPSAQPTVSRHCGHLLLQHSHLSYLFIDVLSSSLTSSSDSDSRSVTWTRSQSSYSILSAEAFRHLPMFAVWLLLTRQWFYFSYNVDVYRTCELKDERVSWWTVSCFILSYYVMVVPIRSNSCDNKSVSTLESIVDKLDCLHSVHCAAVISSMLSNTVVWYIDYNTVYTWLYECKQVIVN